MKDLSSSKGGRANQEGDWVIKEGSRHMKYAATNKGCSEIRVVPAVVQGKPQPLFLGKEQSPDNLSDAFIRVDTVCFFGPGSVHMICPPAAKGEDKGPVHHFVDFLRSYVENNPRTCPADWRRWQGKKEDGDTVKPKDVLGRPSPTLLVQGYLIKHKGEVILSKEGKPTLRYPVVLMIKSSGYTDFRDKLLAAKDPNAPWGPWNNQLGGDIIDIDRGLTLVVEPYDLVYNNRQQTWYRCSTGEPMPLTMEDVNEVWAPWEDILDCSPDYETLGLRLAKAFNATTVIKVYEKCPVYRQLISANLRDMARDEAGVGYSTGIAIPAAALPRVAPQTIPQVTQAPSERAGAWVPQEPLAEPIQNADEEEAPAAPASPVDSIRDRVSSLRSRLQKSQ